MISDLFWRMDNNDGAAKAAKKWIEALSQGLIGHEIENITLNGLRVVRMQRDSILCNFVIHKGLADRSGNWHVGATATLIDDVGAAAIASCTGLIKASVDFNISYFSKVKFEEEVEIEAKVLGHHGKLSSMMVEVRRKEDGELVALGQQWMTQVNAQPAGLKREREDGKTAKVAKEWLDSLSQGRRGHEIEDLSLNGLLIVRIQRDSILCNLIVPKYLADRSGNWHVGAIATVIDDVGAAAIASCTGFSQAFVNFNLSYFSTVKIEEEVEIEAKVIGHRGKLSSMIVEVRRKENGELIALGSNG